MPQIHARIRANIRSLAKSRGKSLNQLADFAGVSRRQLFNFLNDKSDVSLGWLERVAEALDVDVHDLTRPNDDDDDVEAAAST